EKYRQNHVAAGKHAAVRNHLFSVTDLIQIAVVILHTCKSQDHGISCPNQHQLRFCRGRLHVVIVRSVTKFDLISTSASTFLDITIPLAYLALTLLWWEQFQSCKCCEQSEVAIAGDQRNVVVQMLCSLELFS